MLAGIGTTEIAILAVVMLILFGGKKLPELGRRLGESIKELKNALKHDDSDDDK